MRFTREQYQELHEIVFRDDYPGFKPEVQESPNGDGVWDTKKRYAHVATKYLDQPFDGHLKFILGRYLRQGYSAALQAHKALGWPKRLMPEFSECCLRVLDYPPDAGSAPHTDFDLFTLQMYRSHSENFLRLDDVPDDMPAGFHIGEMAQVAGLGTATRHEVIPAAERQQSIVFFALPHRDAGLVTAGDWLKLRYARSRR